MANPAVQQGVIEDADSPFHDAPDLSEYAVAKQRASQPKFKCVIPKSARVKPEDPKEVVLIELTSGQEELASKLAGNVKDGLGIKLAAQLVILSLHSVDGRLVNHGDAEGEFYWGRWSSKVRRLIQMGFAKLHNTTDEEDAAFLASMTPV